MRTTIDLPEELYRTLKARAALGGTTLRDLIHDLIIQGLRQPPGAGRWPQAGRDAPPVVIPSRGHPIGALAAAELRRLEEREDEGRIA